MGNEPQAFWQGDTVQWTVELNDYLSTDGWQLDYYFARTEDQQTVTGVGQADGSWLITITPAQSAQFVAGEYRWQARVSLSGAFYTVATGKINVAASLDTATETRSNARVILDAIEAVLMQKATRDQARMTIGGQSLDRFTWADLNQARAYYQSIVNREDQERSNREGTKGIGFMQGYF